MRRSEDSQLGRGLGDPLRGAILGGLRMGDTHEGFRGLPVGKGLEGPLRGAILGV